MYYISSGLVLDLHMSKFLPNIGTITIAYIITLSQTGLTIALLLSLSRDQNVNDLQSLL